MFENISGMSPEEFEIITRQEYEAVIMEQPSEVVTESEIPPQMGRAFFYNMMIYTPHSLGRFYLDVTLVDDISGVRFYAIGNTGTEYERGTTHFVPVQSYAVTNGTRTTCTITYVGDIVYSSGAVMFNHTIKILYTVEPATGYVLSSFI